MKVDKCATHDWHRRRAVTVHLSGPCAAVPDYPVIPPRLALDPFLFIVFDAGQYCEPDYCTGDDELSRSIILQNRWEGYETSLVLDILTDTAPAWVLDIGSHVGWYTTIAANLGHSVIAFDADEEHLDLLRVNAPHPLPVDAVHCWIDENTRPMTSPHGAIRLVKIDLEGSERHALRMIEPLLDRVDFILMEVSPEFAIQGDVWTPLADAGFAAYLVADKGYVGTFENPLAETMRGRYAPIDRQRSVLFVNTRRAT